MERFGAAEREAVLDVLASGRLSGFYGNFLGGDSVRKFEEKFAAYHEMPFAVSTTSGTSALHTALLALGIGRGMSVITTPYSFVSTASSILMTGATPIFADVDEHGNLDPESVDYILDRQWTHKPVAILVVHLLGRPAQMQILSQLARKNNLFLIEDCAQALGAKYGDKHVGTLGDIAAFSFQETKTITTGGEGGMVLTSSEALAQRCREIRNHGEKYAADPQYYGVGYNYRMTELQAAIGLAQLEKLDHFNKIQVENALSVIDNLPTSIFVNRGTQHVHPVYFIIGCQLSRDVNRDRLVKTLTDKGVNKLLPGQTIGKGYDKPLYDLPYIKDHCELVDTPQLNHLMTNALWLDIHRFKSKEETLNILADVMVALEECSKQTRTFDFLGKEKWYDPEKGELVGL